MSFSFRLSKIFEPSLNLGQCNHERVNFGLPLVLQVHPLETVRPRTVARVAIGKASPCERSDSFRNVSIPLAPAERRPGFLSTDQV
jgi:hypothetical protein